MTKGRVLLGTMLLALVFTGAACTASDSVFLNAETKAALEALEQANDALAMARTAAEAAKTEEEKKRTTEALLAAIDKAKLAEADLDEALESRAPSPAESLAGLAGSFGLPWIMTLVAGAAATYEHVRAKKGDKARDAVLETVENMGETAGGKKIKKDLANKFEEKGVTSYVDAGLRLLGFLRKSKPAA